MTLEIKLHVYLFVLFIVFARAQSAFSCEIVPISQWLGEKSRRNEVLANPVDLVIIQHTVTSECDTDVSCKNIVRNIRNYDMRRGYIDIGQSFLVGGNGKVYEGAGWSLIGAHTRGYNNKSIAISFIGDFREKLPTQAALDVTQALLACGVTQRHLSDGYHLVGHSQVTPTLSPGAALLARIQTWPHWSQNATAV